MTCAPRLPCPSRPPPNLLLYVSAVMLLYLSIKTFLVSHPPGFVIGAVAAAPPCPSLLTRSSSPAVSVLGREVRRDSCGLGRGSGRWRRPGWISEWWARFPSVPFTLTGSPQPSDTAFLSSSDAPPPPGGMCPSLGPGPAAGGKRDARPGVGNKVPKVGLPESWSRGPVNSSRAFPTPRPSKGQTCQHLASASEGGRACRQGLGVPKTCQPSCLTSA